jgi:SAM-dependent methyltransferase
VPVVNATRLTDALFRARRRVLRKLLPARPPLGLARRGAMRRMRPVSADWGFDRGLPVDRWYVQDFLLRFSAQPGYGAGDIRGRVVEVGGDAYARRFAAGSGTTIDVLHVSEANPKATLVGDLVTGEGVPSAAFDCVICTQTLHVIYEIQSAVRTLHRMLAPGGVALVTVPGITRGCIPDRDYWGDYWRLTSQSAARLFGDAFGAGNVRIEPYGNLLTAMGFLQGMAAEEFREWELKVRDPDYEVLIGIRAQRAADG